MEVALSGFTPEEKETIFKLVHRVRKNIERDWEYVKKGTRGTINVQSNRSS